MTSASKFYSILDSLTRLGFVKEYRINLGGRGGLATFLESTAQGCEAIGTKPKPHITRGGNFVTDLLAVRLGAHFKNIIPESKISIEKEIQGKWSDIAVEFINQAFILLVEIELSDMNLRSNIEQDTERADFVIEACINAQVMSKVEGIIKTLVEEKQNKIAVSLITKLLKCKKLSDVVGSEFLKQRGL